MAQVVSLVDRLGKDSLELPAALSMLRQLTRANSAVVPSANEVEVELQPEWSDLRKDLERQDLDKRIAAGRRALTSGDQVYERILPALRSLRAMRSFERGERRAAYQEWEALIDEPPDEADHLLTRAAFFAAGDDRATALDDLDRAAERRPDEPEVYERRSAHFRGLGDWERALADSRRLVHLRPRDPEAIADLAAALRFTGDHAGAARMYGRAIKLAPWQASLYESRAGCLMMTGPLADERADLDRCLARDPTNAGALHARSFVHRRMNEPELELADLSRAIELDPTHAGWFQTRGFLHRGRGHMELAIADFCGAIERSPDSACFLETRAELYEATGAIELAHGDRTRLIEIARAQEPSKRASWRHDEGDEPDPDAVAKALWTRGKLQWQHGDRALAVADFREGLSRDPALINELYDLDREHRDNDETAERRAVLDMVIAIEASNEHARFDRSQLLFEAGDFAGALADLNAAIAIHPWSYYFHYRAQARWKLDDLAGALEDGSRAVESTPGQYRWRAWRAIYSLAAEGTSAAAEADILLALETAPKDPEVLALRRRYLEGTKRPKAARRVARSLAGRAR
jgi:tetratricopeptide (TPR) repeat protein